MTAATTASAVIPPPFSAYDPTVSDATAFVISRAAEADAICTHITQARTKLVVLCGQAASGKTLLLNRWVIPALRATTESRGIRVFSAACAPNVPPLVRDDPGEARIDDAIARGSIVILDDFDRVLDLPRDERKKDLDAFFAKLSAAHANTIVVVVVSVRHLTSIYALSSYDPRIASAVYQVRSVGIDEGLRELSDENPDTSATCSPEVLQALRMDSKPFEHRGMEVSFELLRVLHRRFARHRKETNQRSVELAHYRKMGGLTGILRDHVNRQLDELTAAQPGTHVVGRAILQEVLEHQYRLEGKDIDAVAARLEVSPEMARALLDAMTKPTSLLRKTPDEVFEFLPPQMVAVIEEDVVARQLQNERPLRIVEEGLRSWQSLGTYLPQDRFTDVHRQRRHLILDEELTRFLAQCSLRFGETSAEAAKYWIGRLTSREDRIDVLLFAAIDAAADVRERAVVLLGNYPDPLVRERLSVLALTDPSSAVRGAAVASLRNMADNSLLERLLQEVQTVDGACRDNAVDALRIFPRPDVTHVLQSIIDDPKASLELRGRAVNVLAALNIPEAVDALVKVALDDPDREDREAAANALTSAESVELNRRILEQLDWRRPTMRISATLVVLALALTAGLFVFAAVVFGNVIDPATLGMLVVGLLVAQIPLAMLFTRLQRSSLSWRSPAGLLAQVLFWSSAIVLMPYIHGLAHALIRRWKRFFLLFGLELLGVVMALFVADATKFVPYWGSMVATFYRGVGVILFVGTYLYDVLGVALELFLFRNAQTTEDRRRIVYRAVFRNPTMADATFGDLRAQVKAEIRRGQKLLRHFGSYITPAKLMQMFVAADPVYDPYLIRALKRAKDDDVVARLEALWTNVDAQRQLMITAVLARKPTARSIEALRRLAAKDGIRLKLRAAVAGLQFRISVWSWPARLAGLCILPFTFVLLFHAMKVIKNPAWPMLVMLQQSLADPTRQMKIVSFLAETYPGLAVDEVRDLFNKRADRPVDAFHSALARSLVTMHDSLPGDLTYPRRDQLDEELRALRRDLTAQVPKFDTLLAKPDSDRFALGLGVLGTLAAATDSELSATGIQHLVAFAATDTMSERKMRTVRALASIGFERALPALASVLTKRQSDKRLAQLDRVAHISDSLQRRIDTVAWQAYAGLPKRTPQTQRLQAMLERLPYAPPSLIDQIKRDAEVVTGSTPECDRNHDRLCDGKDDALDFIKARPGSEQGYIDLYSQYGDESENAVAAFTGLAREHPKSIWPRRYLMFIHHEYLPAFEKSYVQAAAIQRLEAFQRLRDKDPRNYARLSSDIVEVALTAGHFDEVERGARQVMELDSTATTRYNMALFRYMAGVLRHDTSAANARLIDLEKVIGGLGPGFENGWIYSGTLKFIAERDDLSPHMKDALTALCHGGEWYPAEKAIAIVEQNRAALRPLRSTATQARP